ncbi:metallophosphoesterase domain-containing protein 1 [Histomonas meleagridis]|uniref:metallophosphoesterase domain-containing protein 1 n=1 Tax=Histomonas meleagridis TaxID=135588 RepID=UPI00355AAE30|nr:metallophosphoesterase domain-containing protein 1 [Histomonas meleagridis]KAH0802257.1 metallophosphoesterase domain-containing protein 1 [Histomonas meleagridis]
MWKPKVVDPTQQKPDGAIRLLCLSDTHGMHEQIPQEQLFKCDILIFAGDFSNLGNPKEVASFVKWIDALGIKNNIVIAGNSDLPFETKKLEHFRNIYQSYSKTNIPIEDVKNYVLDDKNITYLEHNSCVIDGIKIFGSPYQPEFKDLAFNMYGNDAVSRWSDVPNDADIIITHGPPKEIGDTTSTGFHAGCPELRKAIEKAKPALCIFGHIHEAHSIQTIGETLYCNVSILDGKNHVANKPTYIDMIRIN